MAGYLALIGAVISIAGIITIGASKKTPIGVTLWLGGITVMLVGLPFCY